MKKLVKYLSALTLSATMLFSVACGGDDGSGGGGLIDEAYYYCVNKLENADLSFNFTNKEEGGVSLMSLTANTPSAQSDITYTGGPNYYVDPGWHTYLGWQTFELKDVAERARMGIDELTQTVTVLNKLVLFNGVTARYIGYDEENDIVTGFVGYVKNEYIQDKDEGIDSGIVMEGVGSTDGGAYVDPNGLLPNDTLTGAILIKIYDDADGDEVIEYSTFDYVGIDSFNQNRGKYNCYRIKYAPLKEYFVERSVLYTNPSSLEVLENQGEGSVFRAINVNGNFIGSKAIFDFSTANDPVIEGESFIEMDGGFFVFDLKDEDKRYYSIGYDTIDLNFNINEVSEYFFSLKNVDGWDSFTHNVKDVNHDGTIDNNDYLSTLQGTVYFYDDDHVLLKNGKKLYPNSIWSKNDGFLRFNDNELTFTKEDGTVLSHDEFIEYYNSVDYDFLYIGEITIQPHYTQDVIDTGVIYNGIIYTTLFNNFQISTPSGALGGGEVKRPFIDVFAEFLDENGLTFNGCNPLKLFEYNESASYLRTQIIEREFKNALGEDFNKQGFQNLISGIINNTKNFVATCRSNYTSFERVLRKDMPKREEGVSIVSIQNGVKGKVTVSDGKLDLSGISVTIPKNNLLGSGSTYGVKLYLDGTTRIEIEGAFDVITYDKKETVVTGKKDLVIPNAVEGKYTLRVVFGRVRQNNFMELSEFVTLEVNNFTKVEKNASVNGNNYKITYESDGNHFMMISEISDSGLPTVSGGDYDGSVIKIKVSSNAVVADLIKQLTVYDEVDGNISISASNVTLDGVAVKFSDSVDFEKTYLLTVKDSAGNTVTVDIKAVQE